jgi:hypothetical protein
MDGLTVPQAEQAERLVIGALLFAPERTLEAVSALGLSPEHFCAPLLAKIYTGILESAKAGESLDAMTLARKLNRDGISFADLSELAGGIPSLAPLPAWVELVQDAAKRRVLLKRLLSSVKAISGGDPTPEIISRLVETTALATAEQGLGSIIETPFADLLNYDTDNDPNTVIGNRWLCRGGSLLINAQSGIGKSSLTMQLAIGWALRPTHCFGNVCTFGMTATKPLKSMIVQAENDIGDQAEILRSVIWKFAGAVKGLDHEDIEDLSRRLVFVRDNIHAGPEFLRVLEALAIKHKPDLIWVDPLMCYIGDDMSDQKVVTEFCNGLNRITSKTGAIVCLIHHLPKPRDGEARTDSDLAYAGFGSSALTNWAREVCTMQRVRTEDGHPPTCSLTMTKRRTRAGLTDYDTKAPVSKIYIRHAADPKKSGMVWVACRQPEEPEEKKKRR